MTITFLAKVTAHLVLLLLLPPLMPGVINRVKARVAGRDGPPLLQPYYDLLKLFRKEVVITKRATWVFAGAPVVTVSAMLVAGMFLPMGPLSAPASFQGDWVLFAYLLALGRFMTSAAALDTGSSFEGMGASREVTFATVVEPALIFAILALAGGTGASSLDGLLRNSSGVSLPHSASLLLVSLGLFIYLLAENCRIPVDDPNTHLELTMIHEVMVLDHSGPYLGLIDYGAALKLYLLSSLWLKILLPLSGGSFMLEAAAFAAGILGVSILIGLVESSMARLQMRAVPHLLAAAALLCGFGFVLVVR